MEVLNIKIPDHIDIEMNELKFTLASTLYEKGKLSLGQAAEMAGYSKRTFMELLGQYNVSVFNYGSEELEEDYKNA